MGTGQKILERCMVVHTVPSTLAFSPVGRYVSPGLAGVGAKGHVAMTFDDGPDPVSTPEFLELLDDLGWRATFFMLGDMVRAAPGPGGRGGCGRPRDRGPRRLPPEPEDDGSPGDPRRRRARLRRGGPRVRGGAEVVPAAARGAVPRGQAHRPEARDAVRALDHLGPGLAGGGHAGVGAGRRPRGLRRRRDGAPARLGLHLGPGRVAVDDRWLERCSRAPSPTGD